MNNYWLELAAKHEANGDEAMSRSYRDCVDKERSEWWIRNAERMYQLAAEARAKGEIE